MRVEIYTHNEDKILQAASKLGISPSQLVNSIIDSVNIKVELQVEKVEIHMSKGLVEKKETTTGQRKRTAKNNFVTDF